jgi:hypothetical protein
MPPRTTCKVTTDHNEIRRWAEHRNALPALMIDSEKGESATHLRLKFPGREDGASLQETVWEAWLKKFEQNQLAFLYQDQIANGEPSHYNEIVRRETADAVEEAVGGKGRSASRRGSRRKVAAGTTAQETGDTLATGKSSVAKTLPGRSRSPVVPAGTHAVLAEDNSSAASDHGGETRHPRTVARSTRKTRPLQRTSEMEVE